MAFSVSFLFCVVTVTTAQTPQQMAQKAFRSTVLLVMEDANGQPLSLGSGFFVRSDQIATNLHVVEGAARGYAKLVGQETMRLLGNFILPIRDKHCDCFFTD